MIKIDRIDKNWPKQTKIDRSKPNGPKLKTKEEGPREREIEKRKNKEN